MSTTSSEGERWLAYLESIDQQIQRGIVSSLQRDTLLSFWNRAHDRHPTLRPPAVGVSESGVLQLSWSFRDVPDTVLTVGILSDGRYEWGYVNRATLTVRGTDEVPEISITDELVQLLAGFA